MDQDGADHARIVGQGGFVLVGPKPGMQEPDDLTVVAGDDEPVPVEIRLGEVERLERIDGDAGRRTAAERASIPQGDNSGRIRIRKRSGIRSLDTARAANPSEPGRGRCCSAARGRPSAAHRFRDLITGEQPAGRPPRWRKRSNRISRATRPRRRFPRNGLPD